MTYKLVLNETSAQSTKDVGENVFIENLPADYKVYLFYYPSSMPDQKLATALRNLGNITGKNLFVNVGLLNDPLYHKIKRRFGIENHPVIIITAIDEYASIELDQAYVTSYVRLDNQDLLNSVDLTIKAVEKLFNLFIGKEIIDAIKLGKSAERSAVISKLKGKIIGVLKQMSDFFSKHDIVVSLFEGKFEIKKSD